MRSKRSSRAAAGEAAGEGELRGEVEDEGEVGLDADGERVQRVDHGAEAGAGDALVDAGGVGEAVGDDRGAAGERRADGALEVVAAGGGEEEALGLGRPAAGVARDEEARGSARRRGRRRARGSRRPRAPRARRVAASARTWVDLPEPSMPSKLMKRPVMPWAA